MLGASGTVVTNSHPCSSLFLNPATLPIQSAINPQFRRLFSFELPATKTGSFQVLHSKLWVFFRAFRLKSFRTLSNPPGPKKAILDRDVYVSLTDLFAVWQRWEKLKKRRLVIMKEKYRKQTLPESNTKINQKLQR